MRFESTNCKHTQHSYRQLGYSNRFGCNKKKSNQHTHKTKSGGEKTREKTKQTTFTNQITLLKIQFSAWQRGSRSDWDTLLFVMHEMYCRRRILIFDIIYSSILYGNKRMCSPIRVVIAFVFGVLFGSVFFFSFFSFDSIENFPETNKSSIHFPFRQHFNRLWCGID